MHDISLFRNDLAGAAATLARRGFELDTESFEDLDRKRRAALTETEQLWAQRKKQSGEINKLRKAGEDTAEQQQQVREMGGTQLAIGERSQVHRRIV
jgi:seryl-tRNA synthetase